jgi:hypothetical protein
MIFRRIFHFISFVEEKLIYYDYRQSLSSGGNVEVTAQLRIIITSAVIKTGDS